MNAAGRIQAPGFIGDKIALKKYAHATCMGRRNLRGATLLAFYHQNAAFLPDNAGMRLLSQEGSGVSRHICGTQLSAKGRALFARREMASSHHRPLLTYYKRKSFSCQ